jgi:hypothetical protein
LEGTKARSKPRRRHRSFVNSHHLELQEYFYSLAISSPSKYLKLRLQFREFVTSILVALRHLTWDTSGVVTRAAIKFGQILGDFDLAVQVLRQLDDIHVFVTFDARTEGIRRYSERKLLIQYHRRLHWKNPVAVMAAAVETCWMCYKLVQEGTSTR